MTPHFERRQSERLALAGGGLLGPLTFLAAWLSLGFQVDGYSPVSDAISELARVGRPTSGWMTVGFVGSGLAFVSFGWGLRRMHVRAPGWFAIGNGVATLGVAAAPLGSSIEAAHYVLAAIAYVMLVAIPSAFVRHAFRPASVAAAGVAVTAALALALSVLGPDDIHGLMQRAGLSVVHAWVVFTTVDLIRRRSVDTPRR